jgi:predicted transcriptional regulator
MKPNFLTIDPEDDIEVLKGLASPIRIRILKLLRSEGRLNVNDISHRLSLPQSTVAINVQTLEEAGLISTEAVKAKKGHQKICSARFDEIIVRFEGDEPKRDANVVEVAMPTRPAVSARPMASSACSTSPTPFSIRPASRRR